MATNKRVFTLRLEDEVFDKIGALATKEHRSMTNYIEFVLILERLLNALGCSLPEFFNPDGKVFYLTDQERRLLHYVRLLSGEKADAVIQMAKLLSE